MYTCELNLQGITSPNEKAISEGLVMGRLLGKRLQIRDEVKSTKYNRQISGRIDRRLLSELGHDYYNIFYTTKVDKFNSISIHISVDASSSMSGPKWFKTLTSVVAVCKATSMISNIKTSVSFRTTMRNEHGEIPYVVLAYDSTKDSIQKVITQFKRLSPNNTTPEGLAFEAILDNLSPQKFGEDRYFLNFSDGQPCFQGRRDDGIVYIGEPAVEHTRLQVTEIRRMGYVILSYFIESDGIELSESLRKDFKKMYGKDASFVDVNNVMKISNTLNAMFLKKD
jgi:nitric oxide reductase activation protein